MRQTHDLSSRITPLAELRPHPKNPRNGSTEVIAASLQVNGQYRPIIVAREGVILAGNHTYAAALELGWSDLSAIHLDLDPESSDAKRIMLADNRTADLGNYDDGLLLSLLDELPELDGTGYLSDDLDALRHLVGEPLDLDDLVDEHGEPTPHDQWRRISLILPPGMCDVLHDLVRATGLPEPESHRVAMSRLLVGVEQPA